MIEVNYCGEIKGYSASIDFFLVDNVMEGKTLVDVYEPELTKVSVDEDMYVERVDTGTPNKWESKYFICTDDINAWGILLRNCVRDFYNHYCGGKCDETVVDTVYEIAVNKLPEDIKTAIEL